MSTVHLLHSTYDGYTFACPNCAEAFSNHDNVITHLSVAVNCGQWVIQGAAHDANEDWNYQDKYGDDSEAAQDVYSRYEDFDPLDDDAEETIIGDLVFHHEDDIPLDDPALAFGNPSASPYLSADDPALASVNPSAGLRPGTVRQYHPNTPVVNPGGQNHLQKMDDDIYANIRNTENIYYPFASKSRFDLAGWLSSGALSQKGVDSFLHLEHTEVNPPSFNTSKDLRAQVEALPNVPQWYHQQIKVGSYKTKSPLMLYWRDGLEVVKYLFSNPVFAPCMDFQLYKEYKVINGHSQQVYGEFMSADIAWEIQDELPPGHSFVGIIGASDKTPLMIGTGNKERHPVLISLANIHAGVRMKAKSHAFALVAYLPIPKFLNVLKPVQAMLSARAYHFAMSTVMKNLKIAVHDGCLMLDPRGDMRMIHTPLIAWIADYPEQLLIACITLKCSPISLALSTQFEDPSPSHTLSAIARACTTSDPCDIAAFHKTL